MSIVGRLTALHNTTQRKRKKGGGGGRENLCLKGSSIWYINHISLVYYIKVKPCMYPTYFKFVIMAGNQNKVRSTLSIAITHRAIEMYMSMPYIFLQNYANPF